MGEVVLRDRLAQLGIDDVVVTSAGVSTEETGNPIDRRARAVLEEFGHAVPRGHQAHRASDTELREADLVLAMTSGHAQSLRAMMEAAGADVAKLHLWREFDGTLPVAPGGAFGEGGVFGPGGQLANDLGGSLSANLYYSAGEFDVPDPWYGTKEDFYDTYDGVHAGTDGVVDYIQSERA
ncbi:Probable low molecular weight protein-tyrosine-phosphatase [Trueperella bialowiezensis]|uniref:protein-tyrosine-phosphatase n=2 Tax=Trueperella bialowiezensis TaxID=312285 RepID=A0A3S4YY46_9ACTO|nr:Probable low molecular weight protein-tyrosine-phosphatase [Trueperella bialowiezensis]